MAKQTKKITQQWVKEDIFEALVECAKCRPDFEASVSALERQGNMYLARMVFNNCGNTLFTSRLLNLALIAMRDHYKGFRAPNYLETPVTLASGSISGPAGATENITTSN